MSGSQKRKSASPRRFARLVSSPRQPWPLEFLCAGDLRHHHDIQTSRKSPYAISYVAHVNIVETCEPSCAPYKRESRNPQPSISHSTRFLAVTHETTAEHRNVKHLETPGRGTRTIAVVGSIHHESLPRVMPKTQARTMLLRILLVRYPVTPPIRAPRFSNSNPDCS